jgi:hypothetical protein
LAPFDYLPKVYDYLNDLIISLSIFSINKGILKEISEQHIELEKDIQKIVENNMYTIFGIDFVAY